MLNETIYIILCMNVPRLKFAIHLLAFMKEDCIDTACYWVDHRC